MKEKREQLIKDVDQVYETYTQHLNRGNSHFLVAGEYSNIFQIAIDSSEELKQQWQKYSEEREKNITDRVNAMQEAREMVNKVLEKNGISFSQDSNNFYRDTFSYLTIGETVFTSTQFVDVDIVSVVKYLDLLINYYNHYGTTDEREKNNLLKYNQLLKELNSDKKIFAGARNKATQKKIDELLEGDSALRQFSKISKVIERLTLAREGIKENQELLDKAIQLHNKGDNTGLEDVPNALKKRARTVLSIACVKLYNDNFDALRMSSVGAKKKLQELLTEKLDPEAKNKLNDIIQDMDKLISINKIASKFHENWRESRLKEDGTYEPRWKVVCDPVFIKKVRGNKNLPSTIRITDKGVEQDIANTMFDDLCLDYKIENFDAAQVAYEVSKENYTKAEAGIVGKKIHDAWLERNPWAKGSDLDVEFEKLAYSEQVKDLIHYEISKEIMKKEENYNKII